MNKQIGVALYASFKQQDSLDHVNRNNIKILRSYSREHNYNIANEYIDNIQTGNPLNRPGLSDLLNDAQEKQFSLIVVFRICDISRNITYLSLFLESINRLNMGIICVSDCIDTSTPSGKMFLSTILTFAELERSIG